MEVIQNLKSKVLELEIFHHMLDRVKVINFMTHLIFVRKAYIPNLGP